MIHFLLSSVSTWLNTSQSLVSLTSLKNMVGGSVVNYAFQTIDWGHVIWPQSVSSSFISCNCPYWFGYQVCGMEPITERTLRKWPLKQMSNYQTSDLFPHAYFISAQLSSVNTNQPCMVDNIAEYDVMIFSPAYVCSEILTVDMKCQGCVWNIARYTEVFCNDKEIYLCSASGYCL